MKKIFLSLIAIMSLVSTSFVFADTSNAVTGASEFNITAAKGYSSKKNKLQNAVFKNANAKLNASTSAYYATNITVINASSELIYTYVPGSGIYDSIFPTENDHILNGSYSGNTYVVLQDPNYSTFYQGYMCRYAITTVFGYPGNYRIFIDAMLCN